MSIRMIASDIDGTMLLPDGTLSPRTRAALHAAADAGIEVVPATGRPMVVALDVIEASGLDRFWVFANGAVTRHLGRNETTSAFWMDPLVARGLIEDVRASLPGAGFAIEFDVDIAYEPGFEDLVPIKPKVEPIADVLDAMHDFDSSLIQKVLVFHPEHDIERLHGEVAEAVGDHGVASFSGLAFIEVAGQLVTKAMALAALCADLGIDRADVAAFGDNHNDVSMLEWAGTGVAMANATADAKEAANIVIGSNVDDALAVYIEQVLADLSD